MSGEYAFPTVLLLYLEQLKHLDIERSCLLYKTISSPTTLVCDKWQSYGYSILPTQRAKSVAAVDLGSSRTCAGDCGAEDPHDQGCAMLSEDSTCAELLCSEDRGSQATGITGEQLI